MTTTTILVSTLADGQQVGGLGFQFLLYSELGIFYIYFWQQKGQTLGMQVWRIKLLDETGEVPHATVCLQRFFFATLSVAPLGLGFLWRWINPDKLTFHD